MQAFAYFYFLILLVSWDALDLPSLNFFTAASLAAMAASLAFSAVSVTLVATLSAAFLTAAFALSATSSVEPFALSVIVLVSSVAFSFAIWRRSTSSEEYPIVTMADLQML